MVCARILYWIYLNHILGHVGIVPNEQEGPSSQNFYCERHPLFYASDIILIHFSGLPVPPEQRYTAVHGIYQGQEITDSEREY